MQKLFLFLLTIPSFFMAQDKIGNKIYKYGDVYHSIRGNTVISFEKAKAKSMNKTIEYFTKAGARVKSLNSLFLPGTERSEEMFISTLNKNNIETLILIDIIDSSSATMNRTTNSAYSSVNTSADKKKTKSNSSENSLNTSKTIDYTTEMSLRLTIYSKNDGFSKPITVVEGNATNDSPDTSADQLQRRIVRRMAKALEKQNAF